jgi:hypothetical protein
MVFAAFFLDRQGIYKLSKYREMRLMRQVQLNR